MTRHALRLFRDAGYSYVEVLIAMSLIAVALVPAMNALRVGVSNATQHEREVVHYYELAGRLEQVLAEPYSALDSEATIVGDPTTPTSYSDTAGTPDRLVVFLSAYDMDDADADDDPFTGTDTGVVWVRVAVENTIQSLETLVAQK